MTKRRYRTTRKDREDIKRFSIALEKATMYTISSKGEIIQVVELEDGENLVQKLTEFGTPDVIIGKCVNFDRDRKLKKILNS